MARAHAKVNLFLLGAATADFLLCLVHVGIVIVGPLAYLYFGTADLAQLAAQGSAYPAIITFLIALCFAVFGVYSLSGAGWGRRLPLVTAVLVAISGVYILRGLVLVPDLIRLAGGAGYPFRQTVFSATSLVVGLAHLAGVAARKQVGVVA